MEYFKSGIKSLVGQNGSSSNNYGTSEGAETVERLVDRLKTVTLVEDRRDALRALKSLSKRFRLEVGTQAMEALLDVLQNPSATTDMLSFGLESLSNVIGGDSDDEENEYSEAESQDLGERFTEIFIKKRENVNSVLSFIDNYEFTVRLHAVRLLTGLLRHRPKDLQEHLLSTPGAIPKITDLLSENREVIRNDAVLLIYEMVRGNSNIQKLVAFESAFERLLDIVYNEHDSIVAEDCLYVSIQLLKNNSSNQQLFRENSLILRLPLLLRILSGNANDILDDDHHLHGHLDETHDQSAANQGDVQWTAQRVSNVHLLFQVIRALVSPSSSGGNLTSGAQKSMNACGLLGELCQLLLSGGVPADVLTETINTVAEIVRGYQPNQDYFGALMAPSEPPRSACLVLIMSMANERQPFAMRLAALYCVECYLYKNDKGKREIIQTLLPSSAEGTDLTAGHLLCSGLVSSDPLVVWFSCCILLHCVLDAPTVEKERLLRVQMATGVGSPPVSLLQQVGAVLTQARDLQVRLAVLMLLSGWLTNSPASVAQFLQHSSHVPYLTSQACMTEGDEMETLAYGMCAFVLGLCLLYNDDSVEKFNRRSLQQLLENRITRSVFIDHLASISKSESYARAAQKPQPKAKQPTELLFDYEFTKLFRYLEAELSRMVGSSDHQGRGIGGRTGDMMGGIGRRSKESTPMIGGGGGEYDGGHEQNGDLLSALPPQTAEQHQAVVQQYKDLIKHQDAEMIALKQRVKELESQAIASAGSNVEIRRKEEEYESALADLKRQLDAKTKLLIEKEERIKRLESAPLAAASAAVDPGQLKFLSDTIECQQADVQRLTGETVRLTSELEQAKVVNTETQNELASWRQHCGQWRAYYEAQVVPESQQIVAGLEAQLKDLEGQLTFGWQAYEAQSQQLASITAQEEQLKSQADYHQQWAQYWKSEYEKEIAQRDRRANGEIPVPQQPPPPVDNGHELEELTNLRKEQDDLLVLCADQDQKLKEYRKILKENNLLTADQGSDDDQEDDEEEQQDGEEAAVDEGEEDEDDVEGQRFHTHHEHHQQQHQHQQQQHEPQHHPENVGGQLYCSGLNWGGGNNGGQPIGLGQYEPNGGGAAAAVVGMRTRGDGEDYYDLR